MSSSLSKVSNKVVHSIYDFDKQLFKEQTGITVSRFTVSQVNNKGAVVGTFQHERTIDATIISEFGIYFWSPNDGFRVTVLNTRHKRSPVVNDLGVVSWTTYKEGSYIWDPKNDHQRPLDIQGDVNSIQPPFENFKLYFNLIIYKILYL